MQWRESTERCFTKSLTTYSIICQLVFQTLKTMIFFGPLNCEKFDACKLKCNVPNQFVRKLGRINDGEFKRASVKNEL
jgi:hypothetical protein